MNWAKFEQLTQMISADIKEYSTNHVTDIYVYCNLFDKDYILYTFYIGRNDHDLL